MSSDAWFHRVKAAQRDLIKIVGGIDRAAEISSVSTSHIGRMNNARDTDLMPLSVVYALETECGMPVVTQAMAELSGRRLTDPEGEQKASVNFVSAFSEVMQKTGTLAASGGAAMTDLFVSHTEANGMDRVAADLERATSKLRQALAGVQAQGGVKSGLKVVSE
jgi:hypothetical protein